VLTCTGRLRQFNVEDLGLLAAGIDVQYHELVAGFCFLHGVDFALRGENGLVEVTRPGARVAAVLAGQVVRES
jgi:hypothetical protein